MEPERGVILKNVRFLSFLKLRAGYGITGTIPGSPYLSLNTLDLGGYGYYGGQWTTLLRASSNPNSDLRWEKKKETNIGLDFAFFNDRISGSIDWYNRDTDDLIWDYTVSVPPYVKNTITANAGSIRNRGLEVSLNFIPVKTKSLHGIQASTSQQTVMNWYLCPMVSILPVGIPIWEIHTLPSSKRLTECRKGWLSVTSGDIKA